LRILSDCYFQRALLSVIPKDRILAGLLQERKFLANGGEKEEEDLDGLPYFQQRQPSDRPGV